MKRRIVALTAVCAALAFTPAPAQAASSEWNAFGGLDSRWHCGSTVTIRAYLQAQSCVIVGNDGKSYQGATLINLGGGSTARISGVTDSYEAGSSVGEGMVCSETLYPGRHVCFNATKTRIRAGNAVQTVSYVSDNAGASKQWVSPTVVIPH
ncbi:hypothetical protein ACFVH0_00115 [Streptomyces sp. NPDC127117]|uniref:hypothetical protein n=1 Tax=Streptomyces sp. NPDC127117 TaxID=3345368 RepID=UPI00363380AE